MIPPLRFTETDGGLLFTADTGTVFLSNEQFLQRYISETPSEHDKEFLNRIGLSTESADSLAYQNYLYRFARRHVPRRASMNYVILVPTLRCNLSCSYCQVSRAAVDVSGYDWDEETLDATIRLIDRKAGPSLKVEFQGGEPTLRLDLVARVIDAVERTSRRAEFVICTNLGDTSDGLLNLLERPNVFVSTSIDGNAVRQARQRFSDEGHTQRFFDKVGAIVRRFGSGKISALPARRSKVSSKAAHLFQARPLSHP